MFKIGDRAVVLPDGSHYDFSREYIGQTGIVTEEYVGNRGDLAVDLRMPDGFILPIYCDTVAMIGLQCPMTNGGQQHEMD